ncbi:hypothetical protein [Candidatus Symbiobacter mobilis]|nr:hypothetical protein [Candidatus Symbiobacter mobilis]
MAVAVGSATASPTTASPATSSFSPALQAKVTQAQKLLAEWASNPIVVAAVKEANAKGGMFPGMSNAKWNDLEDAHPTVQLSLTSPVAKQLQKWEKSAQLDKLFLRDQKANLIAGTSKTLLFNNSSRAVSAHALQGQEWSDTDIKADPTTQVRSVQIGAPVRDGGKVIGFLHASVSAE